ncbi:MAG: mechanosensitive ion channel [Nitrospirota bacterium]|nr:mechanosensitive ion channel [Nitrospirota bacterium]MDH5585726.1 mechanosensitive ion channel [Nitrospirota bacterium]MDH5774723.1 mechanosensitive ion channel [Nitrospirota bacterium]
MVNVERLTQTATELLLSYGPKLLLALLTLLVGFLIIKRVMAMGEAMMERSQVEITLRKFLVNLGSLLLKALVIISVASMVGVETTSFIAMLGAAGLAVGLALQGSLANFAGGVLILFFKPFKVGDLIEAQGYLGIVKEIQIFVTILTTPDNKRIIIPNGLLSNGCLTNLNAEPHRRVDMTFGISYGDDILKVKRTLQDLIAADNRVLADPASEVYVKEHGESSINILVRVWVKPENYWGVYFHMHEQVKLTFDREGVSIPFPQRDVHMIPASKTA